jgi:hypothetical protein
VPGAIVHSVAGSEYDLREGAIVHSTIVLGTALNAEWAAVRIRRAIEGFGAKVGPDSTNSRLTFTKEAFRSMGTNGVVTVVELPDGIEVTAGVDAPVEIGVPVALLVLLAVLYYFSVIDGWAFGIFTALLLVGSTIRGIRIANMLRALSRAGAGIADHTAA